MLFRSTSIKAAPAEKRANAAAGVHSQLVSGPAFAAAIILAGAGAAAAAMLEAGWPLILTLPPAIYLLFSLKVA